MRAESGQCRDREDEEKSIRVLPKRDLVAITLAGLGALLVFVSLLVDWQLVGDGDAMTSHVGIADIPTWGTVYVISAMILIAVFVCLVVLPTTFGPAARVLGVAWSLGVAAIIVAMLVRLTGTPALTLVESGTTTRWGPGIISAALAVTVLMGAFIAACPPLKEPDVSAAVPRQTICDSAGTRI